MPYNGDACANDKQPGNNQKYGNRDTPSGQSPKSERPKYIKLLLYGKRPEVEEWLVDLRLIKISSLVPKKQIQNEACAAGYI